MLRSTARSNMSTGIWDIFCRIVFLNSSGAIFKSYLNKEKHSAFYRARASPTRCHHESRWCSKNWLRSQTNAAPLSTSCFLMYTLWWVKDRIFRMCCLSPHLYVLLSLHNAPSSNGSFCDSYFVLPSTNFFYIGFYYRKIRFAICILIPNLNTPWKITGEIIVYANGYFCKIPIFYQLKKLYTFDEMALKY